MPRIATAIGLAVLLATNVARGDRSQAAQYFAAGQQAFEKGDYVTAIRAFEQSQRAESHPNTLYALAQSYHRQFDRDQDLAKVQRATLLAQGEPLW